ncbi:MAG: FkbM family methyltransferase [Pseudoxanthomonas sp.]
MTIKRRLPIRAGGGVLYASGKVGGLKYLFKPADVWDPELLRIAGALVRSGDSVWDVGTNVGLFSKAAACLAGPTGAVLSVEADLDAVRLLNRTCRKHDPAHAEMTILPVAIGEETGVIRFAIAKRARAANAIEGFGSTQMGGVLEVRTLPCFTLDDLSSHFRPPDVLKIDVEGAECLVLRGATTILRDVRPLVYCEIQSASWHEVTSLLERHDYLLRDGEGFDGGLDCPPVDQHTSNLVAIPREKGVLPKGRA